MRTDALGEFNISNVYRFHFICAKTSIKKKVALILML